MIKLLEEYYSWISFIWCFSHRLKLALKDGLKQYMEPVDKMLTHLHYLYTKSSRKHRELKISYILKGEIKMYTSGVRPVKATCTRWIDHKLIALDLLTAEFRLYFIHLNDMISTNTNSKEKTTLEGRFNKLVDPKVLLH